MLVRVPTLLTAEQAADFRGRLAAANWQDGRITAGFQSAEVKTNLQLRDADPVGRELGDQILRALERNGLFVSAALPRYVYPPLFNRYDLGMGFGFHVDNAVRQVPGTANRLRTDVSATIFLTPPEDYDGGELVIEDSFGVRSVKLAAGDMIVYPATSRHEVRTVTRGSRLAAFFWCQSMVKDEGQRRLLFEMDLAIQQVNTLDQSEAAALQLTACYHNLLRRWSEV